MVIPQISLDLMEAYAILQPLGLFILGITIYAVFIFNFYRFLSRKNIINLNLEKHNQARLRLIRKLISSVFYVVKFLILFPVFVFFWYFVLAALLSAMARDQSIDAVLMVAMAVVGAIRVTAYYNEALSTDLAKILPFALLGIMIIDSSLISFSGSTDNFREAITRWDILIYYLVAVVVLELLLRIVFGFYGYLKGASERAEAKNAARRAAITDTPETVAEVPTSGG